MFGPTRLFFALRRHPQLGTLGAVVVVSALFAATPFLIPAVAADYEISIGRSGLLSAAQVGGFAITAFVAGRWLRTHRGYLVGASLASAGLNLLSAFAPTFELLLVLRVLAGASAGLLVWLAWSRAMQSSGAMRNVAAAGPLTVLVAAPVFGYLATEGGATWVYLALAAIAAIPAFLPAQFVGYRQQRQQLSPSRSNVVLIVTLGLSTLAGSALFVYGAAIGADLGLSSTTVSLAFSANALAGLVAAKWPVGQLPGGVWMWGTALCAALVAFGGTGALFFFGLAMWGFCFWMATPDVLHAVAQWSRVPDERVGDAQSSLAAGRAIGPAVGSLFVIDGSYTAVGAFAVIGLVAAGTVALAVWNYRRSHEPPALAVEADA